MQKAMEKKRMEAHAQASALLAELDAVDSDDEGDDGDDVSGKKKQKTKTETKTKSLTNAQKKKLESSMNFSSGSMQLNSVALSGGRRTRASGFVDINGDVKPDTEAVAAAASNATTQTKPKGGKGKKNKVASKKTKADEKKKIAPYAWNMTEDAKATAATDAVDESNPWLTDTGTKHHSKRVKLNDGSTAGKTRKGKVCLPVHVKVIFGIKYCRNLPENVIFVIITCASLCLCGLRHH